jgi:hypothetical protein
MWYSCRKINKEFRILIGMLQNREIVPWRCHVCSRQFDALGDAICNQCGRATYNVCFAAATMKLLGQRKQPAMRICRKRAEKKGTQLSQQMGDNAK